MKNFIILLLLSIMLYGDNSYELKLYEAILPKIFHKNELRVYTKNSDILLLLQKSRYFTISNECLYSDVLIGKKFNNLNKECENIPMFALSYRSFKKFKNSFGAFYWRKGRPQIIFKANVIKRFHLYLPNQLKKYTQ